MIVILTQSQILDYTNFIKMLFQNFIKLLFISREHKLGSNIFVLTLTVSHCLNSFFLHLIFTCTSSFLFSHPALSILQLGHDNPFQLWFYSSKQVRFSIFTYKISKANSPCLYPFYFEFLIFNIMYILIFIDIFVTDCVFLGRDTRAS